MTYFHHRPPHTARVVGDGIEIDGQTLRPDTWAMDYSTTDGTATVRMEYIVKLTPEPEPEPKRAEFTVTVNLDAAPIREAVQAEIDRALREVIGTRQAAYPPRS